MTSLSFLKCGCVLNKPLNNLFGLFLIFDRALNAASGVIDTSSSHGGLIAGLYFAKGEGSLGRYDVSGWFEEGLFSGYKFLCGRSYT